jgi:hypothetical protein
MLFLGVAGRVIPMTLAAQRSSSKIGSRDDADFGCYFNPLSYNYLDYVKRSCQVPNGFYLCTCAELGYYLLGIVCAIVAVPLFLFIPPFWSVLLSFISSSAQALVVLELAIFAGLRKAPDYVKKNQ